MTDGWRYIAQRFDGNSGGLGNFLDFNVPLQGANIEEVLSGHNALSGVVVPEYARLKGPDGRPVLEEYGAALWAESPDGELWGGLLTHSGFDDNGAWAIECTDLSGTSIGLPFTEEMWWVNVDPIDIFREIWRYMQRQPNGNLGISMDPTTSPKRLGTDLIQTVGFDLEPDASATPGDPEPDIAPVPVPVAPNRYANNGAWREAGVKAMKAVNWDPEVVDKALGKWLNKDEWVKKGWWVPLTDKERLIRDKTIDKIGLPPNPPIGTVKTATATVVDNGFTLPEPSTPDAPPAEPAAAAPTYQHDAYKLNWYTNLDLDAEISDLATDTPFDWQMVHWWEGEEIRHHIRIGYPRLGRRRPELRFVVGENIHQVPSVERDGAEYANEVLVLGAGEGSSMIMGRAFRREDNRVRRVAVVSDASINTVEAANARANQELAKRFNLENITEIILQDHPHAPMGSVDIGDEILVEGELGWVDIEVWCRVVSRSFAPDDGDRCTLTLIRSDRLT